MKTLLIAIALILGTPQQTISIQGQYEKFLRIKIENHDSGDTATDVWYVRFVGEVE